MGFPFHQFPSKRSPNLKGSLFEHFLLVKTSQELSFIAVNPAHAPTRRRFTIAHELGHFFLHSDLMEHVDHDFRVSWRDSTFSTAVNWKEIQANQFAAKLLMPRSFLERDLNLLSKIDKDAIHFLAKKYHVSSIAMQIRLTNMGLVPSVLEFS